MKRSDVLVSVGELAGSDALARHTIIDCRFDLKAPESGFAGYLEGHIPGASYAHLDDDLAAPVGRQTGRHPLPVPEVLSATLQRLGVRRGRPVVVYDESGGAIAARAWWLLRWAGHSAVRVLDGGLPAWRSRGLPLESGEPVPGAVEFEITPQDERVLTTTELAASPEGAAEYRLVDARDRNRYRGIEEPIDPIAGHIPGSLNLPFDACLDADGSWLSDEDLRARLSAVLGNDLEGSWAVMCGSGVTACHLAISGLLAGYREPRLYVGSWSEWIRDPSRQVAKEYPS
jgi:thiosulfate/3-mercaptopyruvate sulfurtransferase